MLPRHQYGDNPHPAKHGSTPQDVALFDVEPAVTMLNENEAISAS